VAVGVNAINRAVWDNQSVGGIEMAYNLNMIDYDVPHIRIDALVRDLGGWMLGVEVLWRGNCMLIESLMGDGMGQRWEER
jgi:hypothetical protein